MADHSNLLSAARKLNAAQRRANFAYSALETYREHTKDESEEGNPFFAEWQDAENAVDVAEAALITEALEIAE